MGSVPVHQALELAVLREPPVQGECVEKDPVFRVEDAVAVLVVNEDGMFRQACVRRPGLEVLKAVPGPEKRPKLSTE
ncbi:MAG: hypothetical protein MZU79_01770 [Anaerotruncus sp.]|nr:hypothetical protein [Anaerotruncus sp.]